jgi:hypothetical protein
MRYSGLPRSVICALVLTLGLSGQNLSIHYDTLPEADINRRLGDFKNTNAEREQELHALFEEAGCNGENLTVQAVKHAHDPNVVCVLPGKTESLIIVGAHFDFVNKGQGVVDNWSGCSLLPSLYQSLKSFARHHTLVFIGFTDEEKGLVGSAFYVRRMSKQEIAGIRAMVNMDSLGAGPTKLDMTRGDKQLAMALTSVAGSLHLPVSVMNVGQAGRSDSDSFWDRHVPAITVHSMTNETWPILHSPRDRMSEINQADYYDTYRLLAGSLAYLDVTLDAPAAPGK